MILDNHELSVIAIVVFCYIQFLRKTLELWRNLLREGHPNSDVTGQVMLCKQCKLN